MDLSFQATYGDAIPLEKDTTYLKNDVPGMEKINPDFFRDPMRALWNSGTFDGQGERPGILILDYLWCNISLSLGLCFQAPL